MSDSKITTLYTTRGDVGGFLVFPYIFSPSGEWIGWVTPDQLVYSVHGHWVGRITPEPRIVRKREAIAEYPRRKPPAAPPPFRPPGQLPLPPMLPELATYLIDVLDDAPELLPPESAGELRDDID